jgi:hypothetical protein
MAGGRNLATAGARSAHLLGKAIPADVSWIRTSVLDEGDGARRTNSTLRGDTGSMNTRPPIPRAGGLPWGYRLSVAGSEQVGAQRRSGPGVCRAPTSASRVSTPSFSYAAARWVSTVLTLRNSCWAIARFVFPEAASSQT